MRLPLVITAGSLLLGACALLLWGLDRAPAQRTATERLVARGRAEVHGDLASVGRNGETDDPGTPKAEGEGRDPAGASEDAPGTTGLLVRVVDGASERPVAGCTVRFVQEFLTGERFTPTLEESGDARVTGEDGACRLPYDGRSLTLAVRHAGLVGGRRLRGHEEELEDGVTLRLRPDASVTVRVSSPTRGPAEDVRLGLELHYGEGHAPDSLQHDKGTGSGGLWTWPDLGLFLALLQRPPAQRIVAEATLPGTELVRGETAGGPGEHLVDLVLPDTGSITVHLEAPDGIPLRCRLQVRLMRWALDETTGALQHVGEPAIAWLEEGSVHFPHVPLGLSFGLAPGWDWRREASAWIQGPTPDRLHREVRARLPEGGLALRGVALDAQGNAWPRAAWFPDPVPGFRILAEGATGADGSFFLPFAWNGEARAGATELVLWGDDGPRRAVIDALPETGSGVVDLGPLRFGLAPEQRPEPLAPLLASGRVIPAPGAACRGFRILVEARGPLPTDPWRPLPARVEPDGERFRVRGRAEALAYRLRVVPEAQCHVAPDPVAFEPGATDLEIRLEAGHAFAARVRFPENPRECVVPGGSMGFSATLAPLAASEPHGGTAPPIPSFPDTPEVVEAGLVFRWNGLRAGRYALEIRDPEGLLLHRDADVRIPAGTTSEVGREIDLRGVLAVLELSIRQAALEGVEPAATVFALPSDLAGPVPNRRLRPLHHARGEAHELRLLVAPGRYDVLVVAAGHAPVQVQGLERDRALVLEPAGATLELEAGDLGLPEDLGARVLAQASTELPPEWRLRGPFEGREPRLLRGIGPLLAVARLDDAGRATLRTTRPGPQGLALELFPTGLAERTSGHQPFFRVAGVSPGEIVVSAGEILRVALDVPRAALDDARARLGAD